MATFTIRLKLNDEMEVSMSEFYDGMNKGERQLHEIYILKTMENEQFFLHSNVIFERVNDGTNQIDTLAVTKKGIFVFEMKYTEKKEIKTNYV